MRCFLAIDLPDNLKEEVGLRIQRIKRHIPNLKWVKPENYHLTIKFFGEIPEQRVNKISADLGIILEREQIITLELSDLGAFPSKKRARVLWVGVNGNVARVKKIFRKVEEISSKYGIAKEKRDFSLHLTVARAKTPVDISDIKWQKIQNSRFKAKKLTLFRSQLRPEGPIYSVVREFELHGKENS